MQTPQGENNLPGLPAIAYRTGTLGDISRIHAGAALELRLSRARRRSRPATTTISPSPCSMPTSVVLDILTFYQERLANESYLRTATQLRSLTELSRLIGYQPAPGVAAVGLLAFTLKPAPGSPADPTRRPSPSPGNAGAERAGPGPDAADLRDLRRHSRQARLECAAGADRRPWIPQKGDERVSAGHRDAIAARRRHPDRRR